MLWKSLCCTMPNYLKTSIISEKTPHQKYTANDSDSTFWRCCLRERQYVGLQKRSIRLLMPTMNNNSLIQSDGPEKNQRGMRAEASLAHNRHGAPALPSVFTVTEATVWTGVALSLPRAGHQHGRGLSVSCGQRLSGWGRDESLCSGLCWCWRLLSGLVGQPVDT